MQPGDHATAIEEISLSDALRTRAKIISENSRFAYYTTAETATKVIRSKEVWLRDATVMSDFSEISYGLFLLRNALSGPVGLRFFAAVEAMFLGICAKVEAQINGSEPSWLFDTYISCLSLHDPSEDKMGRLSTWHAYGDVAFVMNNKPFAAVTNQLGAFSMPVQHLDQVAFDARFTDVTKVFSKNTDSLQSLGETELVDAFVDTTLIAAIATRHPVFSEERELRIFFRPSSNEHPVLTGRIETIGGIPQPVWALPLRHDTNNGLFGADIPSLLERLIIGPTSFPCVRKSAFIQLLADVGVENAADKVVVSDIPLRRYG